MTDHRLNEQMDEELDAQLEGEDVQEQDRFQTMRNAAMVGKATFPDQIDYYDSDEDEII